MTVALLEEQMSSSEFTEWIAHYKKEADDRARARTEAERKSKSRRRRR